MLGEGGIKPGAIISDVKLKPPIMGSLERDHLTTITPRAKVPLACLINMSKLVLCQPPEFHHRNRARGWRVEGERQ